MELSILLTELRSLIDIAFGITLSDKQFAVIMIVVIASSLGALNTAWKFVVFIFQSTKRFFSRLQQDQASKDFIRVRNRFANHLIIELERLNQEVDWNDFYYTKLQAQVEVEPEYLSMKSGLSYLLTWIYSIPMLTKMLIGLTPSGELVDSLTEAIISSKSRSFLVIGDPGSGKSVSLKHLAMKLAKDCSSSTVPETVVPLYFNLKVLDIPHNVINADLIRKWMLDQLILGQDRLISQFLDSYFDYMLDNGYFFILFDSFDEIPSVMDADEDTEIVKDYALALSRFLHAPHGCRGIVTSRPYRAPKTFIGQKITIKPLSNQRIEEALRNFLVHQNNLANSIWIKIIRERDDLLRFASNPFLLGLLARFIGDTKELPDRKYDLYEHFLQARIKADANQIYQRGLTPDFVLEFASLLAYEMTNASEIGLEAKTSDIKDVLMKSNVGGDDVEKLLEVLSYSKISRLSQKRAGQSNTFSYVHRRFQEYFCARYLQINNDKAPLTNLLLDNRWRETLVLLCEVIPVENLTPIFNVAKEALVKGVKASSGDRLHRDAIETLRFLRDGLRTRLDDLPNELRQEAAKFIFSQFENDDLLGQKRGVDCLTIVDKESAPLLIEKALESNSMWIKETTLYSCRNITSPTPEILQKLRSYLHLKHSNLNLFREYKFLSILLSYPQLLLPVHSYLVFLRYLGMVELSIVAVLFVALFVSATDLELKLQLFVSFLVAVLAISFLHIVDYRSMFIKQKKVVRTGKNNNVRKERRKSFFSNLVDSYIEKILMKIMSFSDILFKKILGPFKDNDKLEKKNDFDNLANLAYYMFNFWFFLPLTFVMLSSNNALKLTDLKTELLILVAIFLILYNVIASFFVFDYPNNISFSGWVTFILKKTSDFFYRLFRFKDWLNILKNLLFVSFLFVLFFIFIIPASIILMPIMSISLFVFLEKLVVLIRDQSKYIKMMVDGASRPQSTNDIVDILDSLDSEMVKSQFVQSLPRWLPMSKDWNILIDRANMESERIRDALYRLCEIWQDTAQE